MATLDEILGGSSPDSGGHAPKGTKEWTEQHSGDNAPVSSPPTAPPAPAKQNGTPPTDGGTPAGGGGYEALFRQLNPYTPPTAEELEKEKKKQRRNEIFAAIGDGVMALSNLFFTTQGAPNMYTGKNTMSERIKIRYDKLMKDREEKNNAYFNGLIRAKQADAEEAHRERSWQRQLGLDQKNDDRYNESIQHRNEREKIADDRYDAEQEYKKGRDKEADKRWQTTFDENKRQADRSYNFQVKRHNDNVAVERDKARATAARGVRGKQLGFSDGDGNQVAIYENVWKGSMPSIYDALVADGIEPEALQKVNGMSASDKDTFVKENWYKSEKAKNIMLSLSKLDPATMTSELNNEVVDYVPGGGDDDVIDYTPGKNK